MNVLMLGNGFDINYSLPTKYINFLNTVSILSRIDAYDVTVGTVFSEPELQAMDKTISDSYAKYAKVYDAIVIDAVDVEKFKSLARENIWFSYLLKSLNRDLGWIDFEKEISTVLHCFQQFLPTLGIRFFSSNLPNDPIEKYMLKTFDFFYQTVNESGVTNIGVHYPAQYDVRAEYVLEYPLGSSYKRINKEKVINTLETELFALAEGLKKYLECFVERTVFELCKVKYLQPMMALSKAQHVVTFNYTNTYEHVYGEGIVYHIHGNTKERIILGINPDSSDNVETVDTLFLPFKKYYQRVIYQSDVKYLEWISQLKNVFSLVVMGHSLDETDKDIIIQMFDAAKDITILFYNESVEASLVANLIKIYGKEGFDKLRTDKRLRFLKQTMDFCEFAEDRSANEMRAQIRAIENLNFGSSYRR